MPQLLLLLLCACYPYILPKNHFDEDTKTSDSDVDESSDDQDDTPSTPIECPEDPVLTAPAQCPAACTGGCDDTRCIVDCSATQACQGGGIVCPENMECVVNCLGLSSCADNGSGVIIEVVCPTEGSCHIECQSNAACQGLVVECPETTGDCHIECGYGTCTDAQLECGPGPCSATCSDGPVSNFLDIDCSGSCQCSNDGCSNK